MRLEFSVGDAVEIVRDGNKYRTVIEKQIDEETILIYSPIEKGHVLPIRVDERIEITYVILDTENSKYDVYAFESRVLSREIQDNIPMLKVQATSVCKKIQRRDFYRLNIIKPILIEKMDSEETIEVITRDVSAGGMLAISPKKLSINEEYLVYVNIFADAPVVLSAKILSSNSTSDGDSRYITRFFFTNIDKKVQSDMVRQINQLQIMEIRKRKYSTPTYSDALKNYLDDELLDRYNIDKETDKRARYLMVLDILLLLLIIVFFVMSNPKTAWAPFFARPQVGRWNINLLKIDIFITTMLFLLSGIGIVFDRAHYHGRKQTNIFFVVMLILSLVSLLGFISIITIMV